MLSPETVRTSTPASKAFLCFLCFAEGHSMPQLRQNSAECRTTHLAGEERERVPDVSGYVRPRTRRRAVLPALEDAPREGLRVAPSGGLVGA